MTVMDVRSFGDALIRSRDLDPVYCAIHGAGLAPSQRARLLLAYWCFYHLGLAGHLSEFRGHAYWAAMEQAAANETSPASRGLPGARWPRAAERRHFRGVKCVAAVRWMADKYGDQPELAVYRLHNYRTARGLMAAVQEMPLFGPWIAFKAADMLERVHGYEVAFPADLGLVYEEPRSALAILAEHPEHLPSAIGRDEAKLYEGLITYFSARRAPPGNDRPCGPQEVETVLCKWKSHFHGRYWVGKDNREVRHALEGWGPTADSMLRAAPAEVVRD